MRVFDFFFYGQDRLWIHFVRRAQPSYIDVSRSDSHRLYGIMLRAVASRGGGPGRRWRQENKRLWRQSRSTLDVETLTSGIHLRRRNTTTTLTIGTHLRMVVLQSVSQCGYQNRDIHGGTSSGVRSQAALTRRRDRWKHKHLTPRKDYREWKRQQTGSTLANTRWRFPEAPELLTTDHRETLPH